MEVLLKDFQLMIIYLSGEKRTRFCQLAPEFQEKTLTALEKEGLIVQYTGSDKVDLTFEGLDRIRNISPVIF